MTNPDNVPGDARNDSRRVFVLGLDGGTWVLLKPFADRGIMPNLGRLMKEGAYGPLTTCFPPSTGPAWASIGTGRNPGKHGVFNFLKNSESGIGQRVINSSDVMAKTMWEILSDHGKKVGAVNVPISYPPKEVNGFVVGCMMTPSIDSGLTYPADLTQEILDEIGDYMITVKWTHYGEKRIPEFMSVLRECHQLRRKTVLYLMDQKPWDFFMVVFSGIDRLQHALWSYLDPDGFPAGVKKDPAVESQITEYLREIDSSIGQIRDRLGPDDVMLIISDHGFGPMNKKVHLNVWLHEQGFLKLKGARRTYTSFREKSWQGLRKVVASVDPLGFRKKLVAMAGPGTIRKLGGLEDRFTQFYRCVDWSQTRAFVSAITEQTGIYINLEGRSPLGSVAPEEYEAVRDEIIARLKEFKDPVSGKPLITTIMKREEYYSGPYTEWAPDILLIMKDCEYRSDMFLSDSVFEEPDKAFGWGCHRMDGIFLAHGGPVRPAANGGHSIYDICPTVLYLMGLPIPDDVDGSVALDVLDPSFTSGRSAQFVPSEASSRASTELDDTEESKLRDRLKGLGYLG